MLLISAPNILIMNDSDPRVPERYVDSMLTIGTLLSCDDFSLPSIAHHVTIVGATAEYIVIRLSPRIWKACQRLKGKATREAWNQAPYVVMENPISLLHCRVRLLSLFHGYVWINDLQTACQLSLRRKHYRTSVLLLHDAYQPAWGISTLLFKMRTHRPPKLSKEAWVEFQELELPKFTDRLA